MSVEWLERSVEPDVICVVSNKNEKVTRYVKNPKEMASRMAFAEVLVIDAYRAVKDVGDGKLPLVDGTEVSVEEWLADFRKDARDAGIEVEQ